MIMIGNFRCLDLKMGSSGCTVPGIEAAVIDDEGRALPYGQMGNLAVKAPCPSMVRDVWGNRDKSRGYFQIEPWLICGGEAYRDATAASIPKAGWTGVINKAGE